MSTTGSTSTVAKEKTEFEYFITTYHEKTHDRVLDFLKSQKLTLNSTKIVDDELAYSYLSVMGTSEQYRDLMEQNFRISLENFEE